MHLSTPGTSVRAVRGVPRSGLQQVGAAVVVPVGIVVAGQVDLEVVMTLPLPTQMHHCPGRRTSPLAVAG